MATNRLTSLEKSAINRLRIEAIEVDCEDVLKCDRIEIFSGTNDINFTQARLTNVADPINLQDCASKKYVDDEIAGVTGGGLNNPLQTNLLANNYDILNVSNLTTNSIGSNNTGSISITDDEVHNQNDIVDVFEIQTTQIGGISGSTMTCNSNISMSGNTISDLPAPTLSGEVATKGYVDTQDTGLQSQITTNSNDITTANNNISTNSSNITLVQNQANTNTGNITTNTNDISTLQSDLTTTNNNVSLNTSQISTNTGNISSNLSLINTKCSINDAVNNSTTETWSNSKIQTELNAIGGATDFTGIEGSTQKVNTQTATSQPHLGRVHLYTAHTALSCGQPVNIHYGANGVVDVALIGTLPNQHEILGICLNSVGIGGTAQILVDGYCTARGRTTFRPATDLKQLNNVTTGNLYGITNLTTFTDSGGTGGGYSSNENYSITFDAGVGRTINLEYISLAYEHTGTKLYDRMGFQTSNDNITYTNPALAGLHTTDNTNPPFGQNYVNNGQQSADTTGNVFPDGTSFITSNGGLLTYNSGARYIKFFFFSDGSAQDAGWEIEITPSTPYGTTFDFVEGATLYIDNVDYTRIGEDSSTQRPIGYVAYEDSANDSVFCRIHPPAHS